MNGLQSQPHDDGRQPVYTNIRAILGGGELKRIRWRWSPSSIPEVAQRQWRALYETLTGPVGATVHLLEPEKDLPDMLFTAPDMPPFVKKAQAEIVRVLSEARSIEALKAKVQDALGVLSGYLAELREGGAPLHELVIRKRLSKDPLDYKKNSLQAEVAGELVSRGVTLRPGEKVDYVITDFEGRSGGPRARAYATMDGSCGYDVSKYTDLLLDAAGTMLAPFGYDYQQLVEIASLSA